jgi:hypothetical protein
VAQLVVDVAVLGVHLIELRVDDLGAAHRGDQRDGHQHEQPGEAERRHQPRPETHGSAGLLPL